ncbi:TPA: hypothetical protein ACHBXD_003314 [Klebsiella pneumoniae]|uniref:hypothetical protein n=1 Tax=Klebsiella pneumoniae TaxID=573 RepID=UPI0013D13C54|nr:hypothetical protein [Klebsiella pneumoniae]MDH8155618.1 hypothetical protein [Klebsiella pneumoniae]MDH8209760.1 hypothetical protein [Klebsiella pneumoniae]MDH8534961.1 hypothetical protein [Klebsiella pneumoniae]MDH8631343.1 hypothetical protein [Klebsiella pneumoniae]MDM7354130.1 hypothetical protein [Klebsiella pneumoniae]
MTITLQAVNELIASLESAGELSIKETKVMALAKAYQQLAAENVALKESRNNLAEFIHEEHDADYPLNMNLETPATDRIVAGIKADAITASLDACSDYLETDCVMDRLDISYEEAEKRTSGAIEFHDAMVDFANQVREGADK